MKTIVLQYSLHALSGFCLLFFSGCKKKAIMENELPPTTDSISVLLDVEVINGKKVIVEATFCNKLDVTAPIEHRKILYSNSMNWGAFWVMRDKKKIPYIGREVYILEEFENKDKVGLYNLMPGGSYTSRIRLHNEYDLSRPGTYTVTYLGLWRLPVENGNEDLFWVRSNTVEFKLKKGIPRNHFPPISEKDLLTPLPK